ncbi:divalent-cation tolerance protein CutA [Candidatus Bathyarchaeota archaeon]|nr:divalent-cation tolerance protein CutA [Candidatus Bathyarchaeota archaeon]
MEVFVQILTTCETKGQAEKIAEALVDRKIAGCVQIVGPVTSIYRWKGRIEKAEEWLCIIKTKAELYNEVEKTLIQNHTYETPEIISTPITAGSTEYLEWLENEVRTAE